MLSFKLGGGGGWEIWTGQPVWEVGRVGILRPINDGPPDVRILCALFLLLCFKRSGLLKLMDPSVDFAPLELLCPCMLC